MGKLLRTYLLRIAGVETITSNRGSRSKSSGCSVLSDSWQFAAMISLRGLASSGGDASVLRSCEASPRHRWLLDTGVERVPSLPIPRMPCFHRVQRIWKMHVRYFFAHRNLAMGSGDLPIRCMQTILHNLTSASGEFGANGW